MAIPEFKDWQEDLLPNLFGVQLKCSSRNRESQYQQSAVARKTHGLHSIHLDQRHTCQ